LRRRRPGPGRPPTSTELIEILQAAVAGRYQIAEEIGRGGAARVFRARDLPHERAVAIKVLRPDLMLSPERFHLEILTLARLQHPNIVPLFDSGGAERLLYFVMPLVEGESLRNRLERGGPLPIEDAVSITLEVADALGYAHARGLVHRDVKPENILLSEGHAIVTDFGIARAIERSVDSRTTGSGIAIGTPAYMSPEQASADAAIDGRSDQYSLACVLYEMLAGQAPCSGGSPQAIRARRARAPLPPLRQLRPELPESLDTATRRALALAPEDRFDSMRAFADALLPDLPRAASKASSGPARVRLAKWARLPHRWRGGSLLRLALLLLVTALLARLGIRLAAPDSRVREALAGFDPRRIAVLYFDDHSPDRSLGYLASGLTESLIHELSSVSAIQVVSRNGVKPFRDRPLPMDSIFATLRVGSLVEGSVQRSADRIRVTVQLIDARTNTHLESATIERDLGELFRLEDDLAHEVASLLRRRIGLTIRVRETIAGTASAAARELMFRADQARDEAETAAGPEPFDLAKVLAQLRTADSLLAGAERADRRWIAPVIGRGWVALDAALRQGGEPRAEAFQRALFHVEKALARDPNQPAALELRGTVLHFQAARLQPGDAEWAELLSRAQADLQRAVALDSSLATAWGMLSRVRILQGNVVAAEANAKSAFAMDAYLKDAPDILVSLYAATLMRGSLTTSWQWCERGARDYPRDPRFVECRLTLLAEDPARPPDARLAWALVQQGDRLDPPEQSRAIGRPYLPFYRRMMAAIVSARAGERDSARAVAARAHGAVAADAELRVDLAYEEAYLHVVLGEPARAVHLLSEYLRARPSLRNLVAKHPRWRALQADSAFTRLLARPPGPIGHPPSPSLRTLPPAPRPRGGGTP
jgi:TolB-like protein